MNSTIRLHNPRHLPLLDLDEQIGTVFLDRENCLWMNTYSGKLLRGDLGTGKIIQCFMRDTASGSGTMMSIGAMIQDREGTVWFATGASGLLHYSYSTDILEAIHGKMEDVNGFHWEGGIACLYEDPDGNIWVGTDRGINIFNPGKQKFVSVPLSAPQATAAPKYGVTNFLERKNGDIWVATYGGGIFVFDRFLQFRKNYPADMLHPYRQKVLPHVNAWSMLELDDG